MIINFAGETCHRIAFLIASDSSTCTIYIRMTSTSSTKLESTQYWCMQLRSMSSSPFPPMCLLNQKLSMMRRRRRPSEWTVYGLLFFTTSTLLLLWRERKQRISLCVPATILVLEHWDKIKSIYIGAILTQRWSVNIGIINIDSKLSLVLMSQCWLN